MQIKRLVILLFTTFCTTFGQPTNVVQLAFSTISISSQIEYKGTIVDGARWKDASGEFLFFVTQTGALPSKSRCITDDGCKDAEINGYCYVKSAEAYQELWHTTDYERNCPFDLYAGLADSAITVTDLDSNGIAECSFVYLLSCRSDVSPATLKLIVHEGRKKYAIRGTTTPDPTDKYDESGGKMVVDKSFNSADKRILDFAVRQFMRFVINDKFKQF